MRLAPAIVACVLLAPGVFGSSWVERIFDHLQSGRESVGVAAVERRASLDTVAQEYAREVAARPHSERLIQQRPIGRYLGVLTLELLDFTYVEKESRVTITSRGDFQLRRGLTHRRCRDHR